MLASWLTGTTAGGRSYPLVAAAPFALGLLVMSLSGSIYTWAVLSSSLEASLGLSGAVIARCGTCLNVGTFLSFLPGLAADAWGPKPVLLAGALAAGGGWGALSLLATYAAARGGNAVAAGAGVSLFCVGFGSSCMITASLVCNTNNHGSADRGPAVAALLACFSLSSGFFGAWLAVVFAYDDAASLRFLAAATLVGGTAGALGTAALDRAAKAPPRQHAATYARAGVVVFAAITAAGALGAFSELADWALVASSAVGFLAAVSLALRVLGAAPDVAYGAAAPADAEDAEAEALIAGDDDGPPAPPKRRRPRSLRLSEAAATKEYWLLGAAFAIVAGSGLALLDEASAIVDSVGADDDPAATTRLVALFAAATTLSKLAVGAAARAVEAARKRGSPTTCAFVLAVDAAFMALAVAGLAGAVRLGSSAGATAAAAFVGAGFGASWVLAPLATRDVFGPEHYGAIHGSYSLLIAAASSALYALLAADDVAAHATDGGKCFDSYACLAATFDVVIVLNVGAALCAALLESHLRARPSKSPPTVVTK